MPKNYARTGLKHHPQILVYRRQSIQRHQQELQVPKKKHGSSQLPHLTLHPLIPYHCHHHKPKHHQAHQRQPQKHEQSQHHQGKEQTKKQTIQKHRPKNTARSFVITTNNTARDIGKKQKQGGIGHNKHEETISTFYNRYSESAGRVGTSEDQQQTKRRRCVCLYEAIRRMEGSKGW